VCQCIPVCCCYHHAAHITPPPPQVTVIGPQLEVIKRDKFWGHGSNVLGPAGPEEYSTPLGELEYLLDRDGKQ
jgi:hypothetical protein